MLAVHNAVPDDGSGSVKCCNPGALSMRCSHQHRKVNLHEMADRLMAFEVKADLDIGPFCKNGTAK